MKRILVHKPRWISFAVYSIPFVIAFFFAFFYGRMQMVGLYGGDAGDLVTNAYLWGIPHPPGYPLYTFLGGILSRMLPFGTVAWRIGFLSSIPTALALFFLWRVGFRITKSWIASTIATVVYGFLGPIWLNAITQEVFGLFSLFAMVWMERYITWLDEKKPSQLLFLSFWTGLSITHHQLILFCILPALILVFRRFRSFWPSIAPHWWKMLIVGSIGLLPYLYVPIAAHAGIPFDQENASTVQGFIRLVTRASYGSFRAAANITPRIIDRILNVFTFLQFTYRDFGIVGCIMIVTGCYTLRKQRRELYDYLLFVLFLWMFYFFYAGFPLLLNFHIGTLERFFIVPYQVLSMFFAIGLSWYIRSFWAKMHRAVPLGLLLFTLLFVVLAMPFYTRWKTNIRAFSYLREDHSMEYLAEDILSSAPANSILFVSEDTTTYAMYDALYVRKLRPDVQFVRFQLLGLPHYRAYLRKAYPSLHVPSEELGGSMAELISDFTVQNMQRFPIMSDAPISWISGSWLPIGLLYSYFPDTDVTTLNFQGLMDANSLLWSQFRPSTMLKTYQKELPMLSDTLRIYSQHQVNVANVAVFAHLPLSVILEELQKALALGVNVVPEYYLPPVSYLLRDNRCLDAKEVLALLYDMWGEDKVLLREYVEWQSVCGSDTDVDAHVTSFRQKFPKETDFLSQ